MLDIELFRSDPDKIRESQKRRYKDVGLVDQVLEYDNEWRQSAWLPSPARAGARPATVGGSSHSDTHHRCLSQPRRS